MNKKQSDGDDVEIQPSPTDDTFQRICPFIHDLELFDQIKDITVLLIFKQIGSQVILDFRGESESEGDKYHFESKGEEIDLP